MDEPFSAVDPIVRERLQAEFLRLQETVRKTIVFVTHDIEEAVRLGDRIAVMSAGRHGRAVRHPGRAARAGRPTPFVADFVGADRGLKRLAVTAIDAARPRAPAGRARRRHAGRRPRGAWTAPAPGGPSSSTTTETCTAGCPPTGDRRGHRRPAARRMEAWVPADASLKTAFATMLQHDAGWVAVLDGDRFLGVLTPESLHAALRRSVEGAVPETAGGACRPRR